MKPRIIGLTLGVAVLFWCLPSAGAQQLQVQAVLITDASSQESELWAEISGRVAVDQVIILESRDRSTRAGYRVRHVYSNHVLLEQPLNEDWVAGSRLLQ